MHVDVEGPRPAEKPDPESLLAQAVLALEGHRSISAKIRQRVDLFGQELLGAGYYTERRHEGKLQFRMAVNLQADPEQEPSNLLKVFDGRYLWTYRNLAGSESLGRIDVEHVKQGLEESGGISEIAELGKWPGLGGMPRLLRGLTIAFRFDTAPPVRVRLRNRETGWKIVGVWKTEQLLRAVPSLKESIEADRPIRARDLPAHLPLTVVLVLGHKDAFPYLIDFRRSDADGLEEAADQEGMTLELFQVELDGPTKPSWFVHNPGDMNYADQTRNFLKSLGVE